MNGWLARQRQSDLRPSPCVIVACVAMAALGACSKEQEETETPRARISYSAERAAIAAAEASARAEREAGWAKDAEERKKFERDYGAILGRGVRPFNDDLCFTDANGDGIRDIALWSGYPSKARLVLVDGKTGDGIWATPLLPGVATGIVHCADSSTIVIGVSDFTVRAYEATTGQLRWTVKTSDAPVRFGSGDGCVSVRGNDARQTGLSVKTGAEQPCASREDLTDPFPRQRAPATKFVAGGLDVTISARQEGTPMLTLTASNSANALWQRELGIFTADSPHRVGVSYLAYADRVIVAGGIEPSQELALVGIDVPTGSEIWRRKFGDAQHQARLAFVIVENGRFYAAVGRLSAIDPSTGKSLWDALLPKGVSGER